MIEMKRHELSVVLASAVVVLVVLAAFVLGVVVGDRIGQAREPAAEVPSGLESVGFGEEMATVTMMDSEVSGQCGPEAEGPMVCLERVSVTDDEVIFELSYVGFAPSTASGMHAHLYAGSQSPDEVGVGGGGMWQVVDQTTIELLVSDPVVKEMLRSGLACVATADVDHTLVHESVSCLAIAN